MTRKIDLKRAEEYGVVCFFSLTSGLIGVEVFSRYVIGRSLVGIAELIMLCFVWATFWGASLCLKRGMHVRIESLVRFLPPRIVGYLGMGINLGICVFLVSLIRATIQLVYLGWDQLTPALSFRYSYFSLALLSSAVSMLLHLIVSTFLQFRDMFKED